jgi:hypothetical protein
MKQTPTSAYGPKAWISDTGSSQGMRPEDSKGESSSRLY